MLHGTGLIYRTADMWPVRTLGRSKWGATTGQVMCGGWDDFIKIIREGNVYGTLYCIALTRQLNNIHTMCILAVGVIQSHLSLRKKQ